MPDKGHLRQGVFCMLLRRESATRNPGPDRFRECISFGMDRKSKKRTTRRGFIKLKPKYINLSTHLIYSNFPHSISHSPSLIRVSPIS